MQINKSYQRLVIIVIILITNFSLVAAETAPPPPIPSSYYGTAKLDGENIDEGDVITAMINDQVAASTQVEIYEGESVYAIVIPGNESTEGLAVEFYVNGLQSDQDGIWHAGSNTELNLTFTSNGDENYHIFLPLILH